MKYLFLFSFLLSFTVFAIPTLKGPGLTNQLKITDENPQKFSFILVQSLKMGGTQNDKKFKVNENKAWDVEIELSQGSGTYSLFLYGQTTVSSPFQKIGKFVVQNEFYANETSTSDSRIVFYGRSHPEFKMIKLIVKKIDPSENLEPQFYYLDTLKDIWIQNIYFRQGSGQYETLAFGQKENSNEDIFLGSWITDNLDTQSMPELLPSARVNSENILIRLQAEKIVGYLQNNDSKIKAVYDWVTNNIAYDTKLYQSLLQKNFIDNNLSSTFVLEKRKGICTSYAALTVAFLRALSIPARLINGTVLINENSTWESHAWVEAFAEGRWITMDPTWDAGSVAFNQNTNEYSFMPSPTLTYFDPTPAQFNKSHQRISVMPD